MTLNTNKVKVLTCEFFEHVTIGGHFHRCRHPKNLTRRCGYDKLDVGLCPLVGRKVYKEIVLTKPDVPTTKIESNIEHYGLQIKSILGIYQLVYRPEINELRSAIRKTPTDRYPVIEHTVPDNENHRFILLVDQCRVGYLTIDADSYGEIEAYPSYDTHQKLKLHHESKGLQVIDKGELNLAKWSKANDTPKQS